MRSQRTKIVDAVVTFLAYNYSSLSNENKKVDDTVFFIGEHRCNSEVRLWKLFFFLKAMLH